MTNAPIFVLGAGRSGTTLIRFALDTHPRIAVPCEWNFTVPLVRTYAHFATRAADVGHSEEPFADLGIHRSYEDVRTIFRMQFERWYVDYAARHGKVRWGATTHRLLDQSVDVLDNLLGGDAVYIVLIRHPLDQATSAIERFNNGDFDAGNLARTLAYWSRTITHHLEVERELGERCVRVHYEDLVRDPEAQLNALFKFLQEDPVPNIQEKMFVRPHEGNCGDHKIRRTSRVSATSVGRWKHKFSCDLVEGVLETQPRVRHFMAQLGYTV